ncbi:MAG: DUF192 domain-containing protein [Methylocystis sp.]
MCSANSLSKISRATRLALVFVAAMLAPCAAAEATEPLEFVTASGSHRFQIEVARTERQLHTGLMNRRSMAPDHGMLFLFPKEQQVSMWMKNTYIPLDMVFVSRKGRVTEVAADAVPMSEAIITSETPAYAVIELNAGAARAMGLSVGDEIRHPSFKP